MLKFILNKHRLLHTWPTSGKKYILLGRRRGVKGMRSSLLILDNSWATRNLSNKFCYYGFFTFSSILGANVFLWPEYNTAVHAIDNNSFHKVHGVSNDAMIRSNTLFNLSTELSFKSLRLYSFITEDPFNEIPNQNMFCLVNEKTDTNKQKYNIQVTLFWVLITLLSVEFILLFCLYIIHCLILVY